MGGGMGGGMMGGGTMPATMGMMMLGRLIMSLVGERDSWDTSSLMMGMMGGMGGMGGGMGGMGGGMGGMGGMMGGGMRSVPPTGLPYADLKVNQTRTLPTRLASLTAPEGDRVSLPEKGEALRLSDIHNTNASPRVIKALARLAADKVPETVTTLVMWNVASNLRWETIAAKSKGWAKPHELSLAKNFVDQLDGLPNPDTRAYPETGTLLYEIKGASAFGLGPGQGTLGLAEANAGARPQRQVGRSRPAGRSGDRLQDRRRRDGTAPVATVFVAISDGPAVNWDASGKFTLPVVLEDGKVKVSAFADALAEGILSRLVRVQVKKTDQMVKGKAIYKVRIDNASPLILNGVAILGSGKSKTESTPKPLVGIGISPFRSMTMPITSDMVDHFGLRKDVRAVAADLSGL